MTDSSVLYISYTYIAFIWEKWEIDQKFLDGFIGFIVLSTQQGNVISLIYFLHRKKNCAYKLKEVRYKKKPISKIQNRYF